MQSQSTLSIKKAYKFVIEPNNEQSMLLKNMCGAARFVWNNALSRCHTLIELNQPVPNYHEMARWLTEWKKEPDKAWLKEAYTDNLQQKLIDLGVAWKRCFSKELDAKKPTFKKKSSSSDSIRFVNFNRYCVIDNRRIKLPNGLGWIKFKKSQCINGVIKNATISFSAGRWFISLQTEQHIDVKPTATAAVGIDVGITKLITLSTGDVVNPTNAFRAHEKKLAVAQRRLSRRKKFSNNWKKAKAKISKIHSKITAIRNYQLHTSSTAISKNHAMVAVEDLKIINMSASAKGTVDNPGKNVNAKSGLNKSILDQGWGEFRRQLQYKLDWRGGILVKVPPQYTSQRCSACGTVDSKNRTSQAHFLCVACGHAENADVNAAKNILAAGHAVLACGEMVQQGRSTKQEPVRTRVTLRKKVAEQVSPSTALGC